MRAPQVDALARVYLCGTDNKADAIGAACSEHRHVDPHSVGCLGVGVLDSPPGIERSPRYSHVMPLTWKRGHRLAAVAIVIAAILSAVVKVLQ